MTLPTDSRQARISRDARNCIFWSLLKTVQRQCYARFQSLETASTEVVDDIINGVIGPNWSSPELSRDVAICLCLWGRDVYGQTMVSSIVHKVFRSAIIRWLWSHRQDSSDIQEDVQHLVKKAKPQRDGIEFFYSFGLLLLDLIRLPIHQPPSITDIISVTHSVLLCSSEVASGIFVCSASHTVHSILEPLFLATQQPNHENSQSNSEKLKDIYRCIQHINDGYENAGRVLFLSKDDYRWRQEVALDIVRRVWINLFGTCLPK